MSSLSQKRSLQEIADVIRGVTFSSADSLRESDEEAVAILRAGNIQSDLITDNDLIFIPKQRINAKQYIKKNDIAMCMSSGSSKIVGKTAFSYDDFFGSVGAFCGIIRPHEDGVSSRFLFHFLNSQEFHRWTEQAAGVNIKNIKLSDLKEYKIPLPSPCEQKRIAAILDKVDCIRRKRQESLQQADAFIKSVFLDMFGDPVTNPKGWDVEQISSFAIVKIGPFGSLLHAGDYVENGYPVINPSHILDNKVIPDAKFSIPEEKYSQLAPYQLLQHDVVVGRRGEMGRCAVVKSNKMLCGTGSMFVRTRHTICLPIFLQQVLSYKSIRQVLEDKAVGVTMKNLNAGILSSLKIPLPPIALQQNFEIILAQSHQIKSNYQQSLNDTETLFKALQQEYFG